MTHGKLQRNGLGTKTILKGFIKLNLMLSLLLVLSGNISAQVEGTSSPQYKETNNKADQNLKSIAHVNPSTLAMEMSVPLMSYPGRNGNSLPVGFNYSSKLWRMQSRIPWFDTVNTHRVYITDIIPEFSEKKAAGWTSNLTPPRIEEKVDIYDQNGQPYREPIGVDQLNSNWESILDVYSQNLLPGSNFQCGNYACVYGTLEIPGEDPMTGWFCICTHWTYAGGSVPEPQGNPGGGGGGEGAPEIPLQLYYVRRFNLTMADGSTQEFRSTDTPTSCGNTAIGCTINGTGDGTYLSVDGSGMRLVNDGNEATLFMSDGSRYLFSDNSQNSTIGKHASKFIDRDGNVLNFESSTDETNGQITNKWIDTLGREITDPMLHNWDTQRQSAGKKDFSLPGINNQPQNYSMTWENLKPRGCETSTASDCVGANNVVGGALEDQTQKLFYDARYFCRGNLSTDLLANANDLDDPDNEVLFPLKEDGLRPCNNDLDVERDASGNALLDTNGNVIPYVPRFNPVVLTEVELPNGKKYQFKYNRFGEITKIIYPTGSYETFVYNKITPVAGADSQAYDQTNRGVIERRVYNADHELEQFWQYSAGFVDNSYIVTTIAPRGDDQPGNGIKTERDLAPGGSGGYNFGFDSPTGGMPKEERIYDENGILRSRTLTEWTTKNFNNGFLNVERDPRVKRTVSVIIENGQALATLNENEYNEAGTPGNNAQTDPEFFSHLNIKRSKGYHFAVIDTNTAQNGTLSQIAGYFSNSLLAGISEIDYVYDANYKARGISSLPIETRVLNPQNTSEILARTQTVYDNAVPTPSANYPGNYSIENYGISVSLDCSSDPQTPKICWQNQNTAYRGKPTTSRLWDSDNNIWIETHTRYDIFGNAIKVKDAIGNEATTEFEHSTTKPYFYAYPTKVITPPPDPTGIHGTTESSEVSTTYDPMTGLPLTVTNDFGQTTATEYDDPLLRPTRTYAVNYTAAETQTIYDDVPTVLFDTDGNNIGDGDPISVKIRKQIDESNWGEAETYADSLGRIIKSRSKDSQGDVFVETEYDLLGRVKRTTNPYREGDTKYWSMPRYDEMGRAVESYAPAEDGQTGASLGTTEYGISTASGFVGTVVTMTDTAGRNARSITNALGQLIRVDEPDYNGDLDALPQSTPNPTPSPSPGGGPTGGCLTPENCLPDLMGSDYGMNSTIYKYNEQGKMVEVIQGDQHRYFKYDSLGRLIRVRQPEQEVNTALNLSDSFNTSGQWTAAFSYDVIGNVKRATDANGTNTIYEYDKANRIIMRCYTKPSFHTTATECSQISGTDLSVNTPAVEYFYDGLGLDAPPPTTNNYAKGKLTKVTSSVSESRYTLFDELGRLTQSQQITDGQTYTSAYEYNLSDALVKQTYPNGREVKNEFEADGDLARIYGKANANATERTYANSFSYTPDGRIEKLRLGNYRWEWAKFNERLQVTELNLGSGVQDASLWKLKYEYGEINANGDVDPDKNTGNIARTTTSFSGLSTPFVQTFKYDSLYRLVEAKELSGTNENWKQMFSYDRYGNRTDYEKYLNSTQQTLDPKEHPSINPLTNRFSSSSYTYDFNGNLVGDAEGRNFTFNGDNKQSEIKNGTTLLAEYFYDGEGKRIKKKVYDTNGVTVKEETVFVYDGIGKLIAEYSTATPPQNPTTSYTATDMLGSPRVITDSQGNVTSRRDFMPFGEELANDPNYRTAALKYNTGDGVRQKFTGYQKDEETNLDFAEARMYENRHARFTAVDPFLASGKSANPQTFNRYTYVLNNPIVNADPTGLQTARKVKTRNLWVFKITGDDDRRDWWRVTKYTTEMQKSGIQKLDKPYKAVWIGGEDDGKDAIFYPNGKVEIIEKPKPRYVTWDEAMSNAIKNSEGNFSSLSDAVVNHPQFRLVDRVTNPDGITLKFEDPFSGFGRSFTLTRDYDFIYNKELSLDASRTKGYFDAANNNGKGFFSSILEAKTPGRGFLSKIKLGGFVSLNFTIINERENTQQSRRDFFTGQSATVYGCYRICVSRTSTPSGRTGYGLGTSGSPSFGLSLSEGTYQFNLHRRVFGEDSPYDDQ